MRKNNVFDILSTLNKLEIKKFKGFLLERNRPQKLVVRIFLYFKQKRFIDANLSHFDLDIAYKKICKKEIETKGRKVFLNALSDLKKEVIDFLLGEKLKEESFEKDQLLISIFQERQLKNQAIKTIEKRTVKLKKESIKDIWQPYKMMRMYHLSYFNNYTEKFSDQNIYIQKSMDFLDQFYAKAKLIYGCEIKNRARILPEADVPILLLEEVISTFQPDTSDDPLFQLYFLCMELIKHNEESNYKKLYDFLLTESSKLLKSDLLIGFSHINNFMITQLRKGNEIYQEKIFDLYKEGLEQGIYTFQGFLNDVQFNNIINAACRLKAFDWAKAFIQKYQHFLKEEIRIDLVHLSKANIYFKEGNFGATITLLQKIHFHNVYYSLRARALLLRTYFEAGEEKKLIIDYTNSFKAFINEDQFFAKTALHNYEVLIKYIRIFLREKRKLSKAQIIHDINLEKSLLFKSWLIEKAEQLKT